jgi:glycosyltransferase involved in cell wall biosynthesis
MVVLQVIARMNLGGTSKYLLKLNKELESIGIKSPIATGHVQKGEIEDPDIKKIKPIRVEHLGRKISVINDLKAMKELYNLILKLRPDIIHTHTFKAGFLVRVQRNKIEDKLNKKIRFIHTFHGHLFYDPEFNRLKRQIITWIERYLSRNTDQLITGGVNVKKDLEEKRIVGIIQTISIPPSVERLRVLPKKEALSKFKISDKFRFRVLWLARVSKVKNPFMVVKIAKEIPEFDFYLVGGGNLLSKVKSLAPDNLKLLGWQNISDVLSIADVFLSTSSNEGVPIAFIQAQLAGIPIIATNVGSVSEVVIHNKTGILCNNSTQQIISALRMLEANKNLRNNMSKAAKQSTAQNFSNKQFVDAHLRVYNFT